MTLVPPKEMFRIVNFYYIKKTNPVDISDILQLFETCLNKDYFGKYFTGNSSGLIMESPLNPLLDEIFMDNLEDKI